MKKKILSLLTAFAMVFGIIAAPFTSASAAEKVVESGTDGAANAATHSTDVVIHKVLMDDLTNWKKTEAAKDQKYDGSKLNIQNYFGENAKELSGVKFTYWKVTPDDYKVLDANHGTYDNEVAVKAKLKELVDARNEANKEKQGYVAETVPEAKTVTTTANGATITGLENGYYWFVEDTNTVTDPDKVGSTWSAALAVPFGLHLPYAKADGTPYATGEDALHVYPKNTVADKPNVDKDFKDQANPANPRTDKNKPESHDIGDIIEYEIKTEFQANTQYKTAFWTDKMTEGLTFNQDSIEVRVGDVKLAESDYEVSTTVNTFKLSLNENGLKKVNGQKEKVVVTISYTAKLNEKAKVDIPETNDVIFHYGNNPSEGNTPEPNNPNDDGEMTVTKTWAEGTAPDGVTAKVTLYDANTGEQVTAKDGEENPVVLNKENNWTYKWTGLDKDKIYKVVEEGIDGYDAKYGKGDAGSITIENHKTNNPKPLNPDEPKVVHYGKKFVKMEQGSDTVRLQGAKFVIKNAEGKFLTKTANEAKAEEEIYKAAQDAFVQAIKAYNNATITEDNEETVVVNLPKKLAADAKKYTVGTDDEDVTGKTAILKRIEDLRKDRDEKFTKYVKALNKWKSAPEGKDYPDDAIVLESDEQGRFEIKGLAQLPEDGKYKLVEIEKPKGYAALQKEIEFTVGQGTYAGDSETEIQYNKEDTNDGYGLRVDNKKVTIPETGGIGSVIFIVAGLAIMAGAFVAYKRSQATA